LKKIAEETREPVTFLGRVDHDDLPRLYGCADIFSMMCRNRWGGLEQEGFGIVFVEAASCGVPQVAGRSGGAAEAVLDGVTGFVLDNPTDVAGLAARITTILDDDALRLSMSRASRERAETEFDYEVLARRLGNVLKVGQ
jgi:phosphatidylinositol alpha-1,6-mannosyltransferase